MKKTFVLRAAVAAMMLAGATQASAAGVQITEWMYNGAGEYIEFTNLTGSVVDFNGWSYDDDSNLPGVFDLSAFGQVANGESVIITELDASQFRADWNLDSSVRILGGYTNNLGRNDQINLYNGNALVDRLTYGDQTYPGTPRTNGVSGRPIDDAALGTNDPHLWIYSTVGDKDGAYYSLNGELGSPGSYSAVPVPAAAWFMLSGLVALGRFGRRRS